MSDTHNTVRREFFATPPLRYVGSKWMLAEWIINQMPPHRAYIEPFCGSAAVFFRKHRSELEVLNDLNHEILNFFEVLRTRTDELVHAIRLTPWSRVEYERALANRCTGDKLEDARRFYVVLWQSFGGTEIYKSGWKHTVRAAKRSPLTDTWRRYDGIMDAANRLMDAELQSMDAIACIQKYDAPDALFYVDPPYVKSSRSSGGRNRYAHEMDDAQHIALADTLNSLQGMAIVSGYDSPLYDEMFSDWIRLTKTSTTVGQTASTEVLWVNRNATSKQLPMFQLLAETESEAQDMKSRSDYDRKLEFYFDTLLGKSVGDAIISQEKRGQDEIVEGTALPKSIARITVEEMEALGFTFGATVDDLFVACTLPDGWEIRPTDHNMWTHLHDAEGNHRASIFYKAAYYDRRAFLRWEDEAQA